MDALAMYFEKESFDSAMRVCGMLAHSDLVPENYQYKPAGPEADAAGNPIPANIEVNKALRQKATANCLIALNKASQLGVDPLTVMQNMAIVYGRPSWSSSFLIATVNTCGRFKPLKYKWGEDGDIDEEYTVYSKPGSNGGGGKKRLKMKNITCTAYTTERGSDEVLEGAEISIRMAYEEGWLTKNGSKWVTMPKQMLMYRAAAFWVRAYAPEVSLGFGQTSEELQDYTPYEEVAEGENQVIAAMAAAEEQEMPTLGAHIEPEAAEEPAPKAAEPAKTRKAAPTAGTQTKAPFMQ